MNSATILQMTLDYLDRRRTSANVAIFAMRNENTAIAIQTIEQRRAALLEIEMAIDAIVDFKRLVGGAK